MDIKRHKDPAILRICQKFHYGCKKYVYFPEDSEEFELETDSKEEMMIWLDLRGLKIGKKTTIYSNYKDYTDYIVEGL